MKEMVYKSILKWLKSISEKASRSVNEDNVTKFLVYPYLNNGIYIHTHTYIYIHAL